MYINCYQFFPQRPTCVLVIWNLCHYLTYCYDRSFSFFVFSKQMATCPTIENFRHTIGFLKLNILCQIRQSECIFLHEKQSPTKAHNRKRWRGQYATVWNANSFQKPTSRQKQTVDTVSHIKQNDAQAKWCRGYHFPDQSVNIKVASITTANATQHQHHTFRRSLFLSSTQLHHWNLTPHWNMLQDTLGPVHVQVPHTTAPAFTFRHKTHQAACNNGAHTSTFPHRHSFASFTDLCLPKSLVWISTDEKYSV